MVSMRSSSLLLVAASVALIGSTTMGFQLTVQNNCDHTIDLYTRLGGKGTDDSESLAAGSSCSRTIPKGYEGHIRHGKDDAATLVEFATKGDMPLAWYDVSIIPPRLNAGFHFCGSLDECKKNSQSGKGFNVPVQVTPLSNKNGANCRELNCLADGCKDAYLYPKDDTKTHSCPMTTDFKVTFCPNGSSGGSSPAQTKAPETKAPATKEPETKAPETKAPETKTPETKAPATKAPKTQAPKDEGAGKVTPPNYDDDVDNKKPQTESGVLTKAPQVTTQAPATKAPVAPATKAPVAPVTQAPVPVTKAPVAPVTQSPASQQSPTVTPAATKKTHKPKHPKHCV